MTEYVRVRDKDTSHRYSIPRERFDRSPQLWDEVDEPAAGPDGEPLPPEYETTKTTDAKKASGKKAGSTATSEKEN